MRSKTIIVQQDQSRNFKQNTPVIKQNMPVMKQHACDETCSWKLYLEIADLKILGDLGVPS